MSLISCREYARKWIHRGRMFERAKEDMKLFKKELEIMNRIKHCHVVELVGSYTDPTDVALIMWPIADCNLCGPR
jgi:hypothetical protein